MRPLNARQRLFAERTLAYAGFDYHTDAYLSVYGKPGMKRRNATINAARVYSRPQVQEYLQQIRAEAVRLAAEKAQRDQEEFRASLAKRGFWGERG